MSSDKMSMHDNPTGRPSIAQARANECQQRMARSRRFQPAAAGDRMWPLRAFAGKSALMGSTLVGVNGIPTLLELIGFRRPPFVSEDVDKRGEKPLKCGIVGPVLLFKNGQRAPVTFLCLRELPGHPIKSSQVVKAHAHAQILRPARLLCNVQGAQEVRFGFLVLTTCGVDVRQQIKSIEEMGIRKPRRLFADDEGPRSILFRQCEVI